MCSDSAPSHPPHEEKKYIVFQSCLLQLFRQCITCHATCTLQTWTQGTMIKVKAVCPDKHTRTWLSQPLIKNKAACNVLLSTAIVATGSSPYKVLRLLELINIQAIAERTYFLYQTAIVQPAIERVSASAHLLSAKGHVSLSATLEPHTPIAFINVRPCF